MTYHSGRILTRYLEGIGLSPFNYYGLHRLIAVIVAISPPAVFAWLAEGTGRWELFERSGSITAAIGLLLASRRYVRHGVLELTMLHVNDELKSNIAEVLEDIVTGKLGLALSAFGSIIWGWGTYLGWWCFMYLAVWVIFVVRDGHRDVIHLRSRPGGAPAGQHPAGTDSARPNDELIPPQPTSTIRADSNLMPDGTDNRSLRSADIAPRGQEGA
jgi:hypothetical protein